MKTIYASIGNSDDKLTQQQWSRFVTQFVLLVRASAEQVHGEWFSEPSAEFQNACICFEISEAETGALKTELGLLRHVYEQQSIAWAAVPRTEFI